MSLDKEQQKEIERIVTQQVNEALRRRLLRAPVQPVTPQPLLASQPAQSQARPGGPTGAQGQGASQPPGGPAQREAPVVPPPGVNRWTQSPVTQRPTQPLAPSPGQPMSPSSEPSQQGSQQREEPGASSGGGGATSAAASMENVPATAVATAVAQALVEAQLSLAVQLKSTLSRLKEVVFEAQELARRMERLLGEGPAENGQGEGGR